MYTQNNLAGVKRSKSPFIHSDFSNCNDLTLNKAEK